MLMLSAHLHLLSFFFTCQGYSSSCSPHSNATLLPPLMIFVVLCCVVPSPKKRRRKGSDAQKSAPAGPEEKTGPTMSLNWLCSRCFSKDRVDDPAGGVYNITPPAHGRPSLCQLESWRQRCLRANVCNLTLPKEENLGFVKTPNLGPRQGNIYQ